MNSLEEINVKKKLKDYFDKKNFNYKFIYFWDSTQIYNNVQSRDIDVYCISEKKYSNFERITIDNRICDIEYYSLDYIASLIDKVSLNKPLKSINKLKILYRLKTGVCVERTECYCRLLNKLNSEYLHRMLIHYWYTKLLSSLEDSLSRNDIFSLIDSFKFYLSYRLCQKGIIILKEKWIFYLSTLTWKDENLLEYQVTQIFMNFNNYGDNKLNELLLEIKKGVA